MPVALPTNNTAAQAVGATQSSLHAGGMGKNAINRVANDACLIQIHERSRLKALLRRSAAAISLFAPSLLFSAPAQAQSAFGLNLSSFGSVEILMLASFGGAMSFAMLAASWMIRERSRIIAENATLNGRLIDIKAQFERVDALINSNDQRIIVWDGKSEKPALHGMLSSNTGAPEARGSFLAFGTWLKPESSADFEAALRRLRVDAKSFDLVIETRGGGILEAQGRTSGSHAFVRFNELTEERKSTAKMEIDYHRVKENFESVKGLFDAMENPVWLRENTGKLYWTNTSYAKAVEADSREAAIEQNLQLFDQNERDKIQSAHIDSKPFSGELPAVISGDRRIMDVVDAIGETSRAGLAIDRSDLANIRTMLSQTEASHAKMLDQLAAAVAIFDSSRHLRFFNSSFQQLWELDTPFLESNPSHSEVIDAIRTNQKLPEQQDWKKWREQQTEVYESLEPIEDWWYLPDGQTLRVIASPQSQGGASWTFENVTERLALESNYNSMVRMQGETLDHLSEAVAVFGSDGKLRLSNPALKTLWGIPDSDKVIHEVDPHIGDLLSNWESQVTDREELSNIRQKVTGLDDERATEVGRLELVGGHFLDYTLVPLPEGQTMLTLVDMTASVNIERALKERAEALEESDHIKSRFLQHVSYELRAPLTTIAGFGELLTSADIGNLNAKQAEYLDHINSSSDTLRVIIDDILDLATIDAGAMVLELGRVGLKTIVSASVESLEEPIRDGSIEIKQSIDPACETLIADPERLQQILSNLLSNAIQHSPIGGIVTVSANRDGAYAEISIEDEGNGIPTEAREAVFNRFESGITNKVTKGTGLGLSIVKSFVELHGGNVEIADGEKRGTRVICRLPMEPVIDSQAAE